MNSNIKNRAIHEAGHGVLCHYLGVIPKELTIKEEGEDGFGKFKDPLNDFGFENSTLSTENKTKSLAMIYIAGREALLKMQTEKPAIENFHFDYQQAENCLSVLSSTNEEKKTHIKNLEEEIKEILANDERWRGVEKLAEELISKKTIPWKDAKSILQQLLLRPRFRIF
jgi:hypothetical protein|tara:strand:- start:57 stop:563 length:507 start_codon:yes stop_codon:yes gene_type:complete